MKSSLIHTYENIIAVDNLLGAWRGFLKGKRGKQDVQEFQYQLSDNLLELHNELATGTYQHGGYYHFKIADPKPRDIHKATVRDRLVHHALYRQLYPFFDRTFIADSYSCRKEKGTHRAMNRFRDFAYQVSKNNTRTCWVLKCDIKKFFTSIDHMTLKEIIASYVPDANIVRLLSLIIDSFSTAPNVGLPLGNLTSQLLVNVYMNKFDQFVKHTLKAKCYIRYSDDFVVLSEDKERLESILLRIQDFLLEDLKLELHPNKVSISTLASGVDFLGWVHFPDHRVLRTVTKRRMLRRIEETKGKPEVTLSYLGLLSHGNARNIRQRVFATALAL